MKQNRVYTTGQVAKMLEAAPRTVCRWIDAGHLQGYRLPPTGKNAASADRRITREALLKFLEEWEIPKPFQLLGGDRPTLLLVATAADLYRQLVERADGSLDIIHTPCLFSGGIRCTQRDPDAVFFDLSGDRTAVLSAARSVRESSSLPPAVFCRYFEDDTLEDDVVESFDCMIPSTDSPSEMLRTVWAEINRKTQ